MKVSRNLIYVSLLVSSTSAFWPFPAKRFKANGLISAGGLGLDNVQGRVVAFGDLDGDQFLDLLVFSEDQRTVTAYLWQHDTFTYTQSTSFTLPSQNRIVNVIPADLNYDGRLDLLFMSSGNGKTLGLDVLLGNVVGKGVSFGMLDSHQDDGHEDETYCYLLAPPVSLPSSGSIQPLVLDSTGSMRLDLLGADSNGKMQLWKNTGNADELYTVTSSPLSDRVCTIADPHSNAVIDFSGDCLADLFLTCHQPTTNTQSFQIWTRADGGYTLAREGTLPQGAGPVSFADMDRDGTLDLVFPVCASYSSVTGIGLDCEIHVAYNKQIPLCSGTGMGGGGNGKCRELGALCVKDDGFVFDLDPNGDAYSVLRLADILPQQTSLLLADTSHTPPLPLPLRLGDANSDGFPDILAVVVERAGVDRVPVLLYNLPGKHGTSSSSLGKDVQRLFMARNVTSESEVGTRAAAKGVGRRTFKPVKSGAEVLGEITDARGVAFLDLDEDGTLDILVQRTGAQSGSRITFIQNNFFQDAFFLKAIVLNGACPSGVCEGNGSGTYKAFGATNLGASFKYTVLDTSGHRSAAFASQLPQTSYQSLHTPYAFLGLGRTNNYIESLTAGSSSPRSATTLEGVIPNSKLVLNPGGDGAAWRRELFLRPGEWMWWVLLTLVGATVGLMVVVFVLHVNEKREDEKERRMALHHINFDAL
ncbi:hypothetical protein FRC12_011834 [Ceratobasidium sp. 428]|nr:hypothetical protein FRC12_011834 [Ceratobasidium sp. 428]